MFATTCRRLALALVLIGATRNATGQRPIADGPDESSSAAGEESEQRALARFVEILEKAPRRGTALDRIYGHHVERGSLEGLIRGYQDRVARDPKDGAGWMILGLLEAQRGRDAAAVTALRKAEETRPDDPLPSYYLGQALVLVGQPDAAAEAFERAIARRPARGDLLEVFQALGRVHQRAQHHDEARKVWDRLEALFPDDPRVQEQVASALAEESEPARALPRYEALAKRATDPYRKVQFRMDAADLKVRLGRRDEALADFESLLGQLNPDSWLHREVRRKVEEVFLKNDDQPGLVAYYERRLRTSPDDIEAMARLGRSLASQGRAAEARSWFDRAVRRAPSRRELRLALIEQFVQEGRFAEAAAQYEALARADPGNPDAIREWGKLLLRDTSRPESESKQAAATTWRKLVEARPNDATTAVQVADLLRQAELPEEAIAQYRRAIALSPASPQYREYLGEYYHALKRPGEALAAWAEIAAGPNRNAKNLGRLAEVYAGFGYKEEALAAVTEAISLENDDFDLNFQRAALLYRAERFEDAIAQLELAAALADGDEQSSAVLEEQIKNYQASRTLESRAEALQEELAAGKDATAARWRRLARLREVEQEFGEATRAIDQALGIEPRSAPNLALAARIREAAGDLGGAAEARRTLADIDRRSRAEHLKEAAKLEGRLGRKAEALKAGRDLLAASPGNPESYRFFADLCFQLGMAEEGLDALRRAVRANPADTKAMLALADNLAAQFRTEEAIELDWRAFAMTTELDGKLALVSKLTGLYLQRSQFDRLVARLELLRREADTARDLSLCLSRAYQTSGDYGQARAVLEKLLAANARDTGVLGQLATLSEAEGDLTSAARYLRQLVELTPTDEGKVRLAQLYLNAGDLNESEALWAGIASSQQDTARLLQAIDHLAANARPEAILAIADRLLRKEPDHWEFLYRKARTLAQIPGREEESARAYRALLDLRVDDDEEGAIARARKRSSGTTRAAGVPTNPYGTPQNLPILVRQQWVWQIRIAAGLQPNNGYGGAAVAWSPADFGQARMAAIGSLLHLAQRRGKQGAFLKAARAARDRSPADPRPWWEWYDLQLLRNDPNETYTAAKEMAGRFPSDPAAQWAFLNSLGDRLANQGIGPVWSRGPGVEDRAAPLPAADLEAVLAAYKTLRARRPEWIEATILTNVANELKRASREDDEQALFRGAVAAADRVDTINATMQLAAERGDVEGCLALFDKYERLQGRRTRAIQGGVADPLDALSKVMAAKSLQGDFAAVRRVLDHYLDVFRRRDNSPTSRGRQHLFAFGANNQYGVWLGQQQTNVQVAYPRPNDHFDYGGIMLLRNAYEYHRRADVLTDLVDHFREQIPEAERAGRFDRRLAAGYLLWWNNEPDEAIAELSRVADATGDADLRLDLAELREQLGERAEALALADAVEPLDQEAMRRREQLALRLSVQTGNVDRARRAAERLFNLRLDTDTQLMLASQMHSLGMHELAEAVLGRARHRAGNKTETLLALMHQYQQQGKSEIALQVAHQILRKPAASSASNPLIGAYNQEDQARQQALQFLGRSGRLKDLIERTEAQLKASPHSIGLLQTLYDDYRAAGDREKTKATIERIARARPDDVKLRFQIAQLHLGNGDAAAALEHYRLVAARDPALFSARFQEVQNAYQQAGKFDELLEMVGGADFSTLGGNPWVATNLVQAALQNEATKDRGLALFRKAWKELPEQRLNLMFSVQDEALWRLPEMYDHALEVVLPGGAQAPAMPWYGLATITGYSPDGKVTSLASRLLDLAASQNRFDELTRAVEAAEAKWPDWEAGRGLLAIVDVRRGKPEAARDRMRELLAKHEKAPIPFMTSWIMGQEFEDAPATKEIARALYESTLRDSADDPNRHNVQFNYSPARRLLAIYRRDGRHDDAYELIKKYASPGGNAPRQAMSGQAFNAQHLAEGAQQFFELGYPVDAVRIYSGLLDDPEMRLALENGQDVWVQQQVEANVARAANEWGAKNIGRALRTLVEPTAEGKPGRPALDLSVALLRRGSDTDAVSSLLSEAIHAPVATPELISEIRGALSKRADADPRDLSVSIASALVGLAEGRPDAIEPAVSRLVRRVEETPLEPLREGARANARQRADAMRQVGLWIVARECWRREPDRASGDLLAVRAVEAASRLADRAWASSMLREWGRTALGRGDRDEAERRWGELLDFTLLDPSASKSMSRWASESGPGPAPAPTTTAPRPLPRVPAITYDRLIPALQVAQLAAHHEMPGLSMRAVRDSLRGGPPVNPQQPSGHGLVSRRVLYLSSFSGSVVRHAYPPGATAWSTPFLIDQVQVQVEDQVERLAARWAAQRVPALDIYETLRQVVLPDARPNEVFLYVKNLPQGVVSYRPESLSALLARWAVESGQADDLRGRVASRKDQPMAELSALILLGQIGLEARDSDGLRSVLAALHRRLREDTLQNTATMACYLALPALKGEQSGLARPVIEQAARNLIAQNNDDLAGGLLVALARDRFERGDIDGARGHLRDFLSSLDRAAVQQPNNAEARRQQADRRAAAEYVRMASLDEALDLMGRFADLPMARQGDPTGGLAKLLLRLLAARPEAERYERLKAWSLPTPSRKSIRLLVAMLSPDEPPDVFGVPRIPNDRGGVASTLGMLIDAAKGAGKIDELVVEAKKAADENVENGHALLALVELARGGGARVESWLDAMKQDRAANRKGRHQPNPPPFAPGMFAMPKVAAGPVEQVALRPFAWADFLVAEASLDDDRLRTTGEAILSSLRDQARGVQDWALQTQANRALSRDRPGDIPQPDGIPDGDPGLVHWQPSGFTNAIAHHHSVAPDRWVAEDGLIAHLTGAEEDALFFAAPLEGSFEFSADAFDGDWSESYLGFGGRTFEPTQAISQVATIGRQQAEQSIFRFLRRGDFNRWTLRVEPGKVRLFINGHLFHEETDPSPTSPWLSLFTKRERSSLWRDPALRGNPVIPEEVRLSHDDRLEGWIAGYYNESQLHHGRRPEGSREEEIRAAGRRPPSEAPQAGGGVDRESFDWYGLDGVIHGRRVDGSASPEVIQSRLYYHRPLREGETLSYEFFYEPDATMVHPSLGHLAFLIEPEGVRLHWMTDQAESDGTGLGPDNVADEPAGRRGPARPPLKEAEWNSVSLSLSDGTVRLALNGTPIFDRPRERGDTPHFGFYHDKARTAVKARNVVLRGPWRQRYAAAQLTDLTARREGQKDSPAERRARSALIGERFFSLQAGDVVRKARALPAEKRLHYLLSWVLPGDEHDGFRLYAEPTPTDPAPPVAREDPIVPPPTTRVHAGGNLEFPARELVAVAKELDKLDGLYARVEKIEAKSDLDRRGRLAMLALIRIAQGKVGDAEAHLKEMEPLLSNVPEDAPESERWPELTAALAAQGRRELLPAAIKLLDVIVEQVQKKAASPRWEHHARHARALAQVLSLPEGQRSPFGTPPKSDEWKPVFTGRAIDRGNGDPLPHWTIQGTEAKHYPGHDYDYLYYNAPLRGDFEVNCELTSFGWREGRISYGGLWVGVLFDRKRYELAHYGRFLPQGLIDPPLPDLKDWYPYRLVVKDGTYTAYVGDRKIHEQRLPADPDPWLAIYVYTNFTGGARNLKITGNPTIPDRLELSNHSDLTGWLAEYYGESVGGEGAPWQKRGEEIFGRRLTDDATPPNPNFGQPQPPRATPGSKQESLLQYHRPMLEDGEITYEFFYEPGKAMVHPALDRLTFLLDPDGVKVHWLTDAQYDRTGLAPDNVTVEKESRRGPGKIPIKEAAWNAVKLGLAGDKVTLTLNDVVIYERALERTNQRVFGLFHYADETEARVRKVIYKGDWPKSLPDPQQLAGPSGGETKP